MRWGALVAFLGLFLMHGATASAAESHCGGSALPAHAHTQSSAGHVTGTPDAVIGEQVMSRENVTATAGIPIDLASDQGGGLCIAILLTGLFAFLVGRARRSFGPAHIRSSALPISASGARPPPRPLLSMLSMWRH